MLWEAFPHVYSRIGSHETHGRELAGAGRSWPPLFRHDRETGVRVARSPARLRDASEIIFILAELG